MIRTNKELLDYLDHLQGVDIIHFMPGDVLVKQDSYMRNIYFVQSGLLKCSRYNIDATEFVQEFLSDGEIIGEIEVLIDATETKTIAEIKAMTDGFYYKMSISSFNERLSQDLLFRTLIIRCLAAKIRYKALRHAFIQTHTLEENLLEIQQDNPKMLALIPKNDLANYFGVTLRSLNRSLKGINLKN